jgi:hypothetical protein
LLSTQNNRVLDFDFAPKGAGFDSFELMTGAQNQRRQRANAQWRQWPSSGSECKHLDLGASAAHSCFVTLEHVISHAALLVACKKQSRSLSSSESTESMSSCMPCHTAGCHDRPCWAAAIDHRSSWPRSSLSSCVVAIGDCDECLCVFSAQLDISGNLVGTH